MKKLIPYLTVTVVAVVALAITSCGSSSTPTPAPNPAPTNTNVVVNPPAPTPAPAPFDPTPYLPLIEVGSSAATGAVLDFAVTDPAERTALANKIYSAANAIYSLLVAGTVPTVDQLQGAVLAFGGNQTDANYAKFATSLSGIYSAYYPKIQGNSKAALQILGALAAGAQDATKSYVSTPPPGTPVVPAAVALERSRK